MLRQCSLVLVVLLACVLGNTLAQPPARNKAEPAAAEASGIWIGQPLDDAQRSLCARRIDFGEGGFQIARGNNDRGNLCCTLDEDQTQACIFYSNSTKLVTGISLIFKPSKESGRVNESWLRVQSLWLHADRSYAAHFAPPPTEEERQRQRQNQPKSVYPPGTIR